MVLADQGRETQNGVFNLGQTAPAQSMIPVSPALKFDPKKTGFASKLIMKIDIFPVIHLRDTLSMGISVSLFFLMCFLSVPFSFTIHTAREKATSNTSSSPAANQMYLSLPQENTQCLWHPVQKAYRKAGFSQGGGCNLCQTFRIFAS